MMGIIIVVCLPFIVFYYFYHIAAGFKTRKHMDTMVKFRDPPKFSGVILSGSCPQGTLVKVVTPDDPTFKSPWDGLTGVVVGVDELHEWYNVMFPLEGQMKFQVFRRHDLEKIDKVS